MQTVEYYINGKLFKTVSYSRWDNVNVEGILERKGYREVQDQRFYEGLPNDAKIFMHIKKLKVVVLTWKINTGHTDGKGNKIYRDDVVEYLGIQSRIYKQWGCEGYYVRDDYKDRWGWKDYEITDWSKVRKVKDALDMKKDVWNNPETCGLEILK